MNTKELLKSLVSTLERLISLKNVILSLEPQVILRSKVRVAKTKYRIESEPLIDVQFLLKN